MPFLWLNGHVKNRFRATVKYEYNNKSVSLQATYSHTHFIHSLNMLHFGGT